MRDSRAIEGSTQTAIYCARCAEEHVNDFHIMKHFNKEAIQLQHIVVLYRCIVYKYAEVYSVNGALHNEYR